MPRQVVTVGTGVAILGLTSFVYLAIVGRVLGPADVVPLTTLWVLINAIGPALFFPLEQEVGRAVAAREAVGLGARPVFLRAAGIGLGLLLLLAAVCAAAGAPLSRWLFDGEVLVLASFFVGSVGLCAQHLTRGAFAGTGNFLRYGVQLGADGVLRLAGALALGLAASTQVGWYAVLLGLSPLVAVLLTAPRPGRLLRDGPPASWQDVGSALGLLIAGSAFAQFVVNAAPIAANLLATADERARVGVFISALVLVRIPLFVFAAVQAALLPGLARLAAVDDGVGYRRRLRSILLLVGGLGLVGLLVVAGIGPWLVQFVYGAEFRSNRADLIPLAGATAAYMLALVLSQALISLRSYRASLAGWAVASLAFVLALLVPAELELRVGTAFLTGAAAGVVFLAVAMANRLRQPLNGRVGTR
ncbi:MAG: polysaccharide biosynthesis protein [Geodermatophilaceae bacterium]|nr:polysaccharide biosynthesis protein [Geodermatophilaceae bacterium]